MDHDRSRPTHYFNQCILIFASMLSLNMHLGIGQDK